MFDEADIDAAIAKFDELARRHRGWKTRQAKWPSGSGHSYEARDWDAMGEILADDIAINDRRPLVNFGLRQGPDSVIEIMRAAADVGRTRI